jgi:aminoglycoside 6'-N-acetyltransferase
MTAATYEFRPMSAGDLPMVLRWLRQPHVVQWWGDTHEQFELVSGDLDVEAMDQYIVTTGGRPFGYIQCYDLRAWPDHGFGEHPEGTLGIDQFIGEPDMVDRGHGSGFIRAFIERQLAGGAPRIVTDPDPDNPRAVRAYEKAGFQKAALVDTPEGIALLMVRNS